MIKGKARLFRGSGARAEFRDGNFWRCRLGCCGSCHGGWALGWFDNQRQRLIYSLWHEQWEINITSSWV